MDKRYITRLHIFYLDYGLHNAFDELVEDLVKINKLFLNAFPSFRVVAHNSLQFMTQGLDICGAFDVFLSFWTQRLNKKEDKYHTRLTLS